MRKGKGTAGTNSLGETELSCVQEMKGKQEARTVLTWKGVTGGKGKKTGLCGPAEGSGTSSKLSQEITDVKPKSLGEM